MKDSEIMRNIRRFTKKNKHKVCTMFLDEVLTDAFNTAVKLKESVDKIQKLIPETPPIAEELRNNEHEVKAYMTLFHERNEKYVDAVNNNPSIQRHVLDLERCRYALDKAVILMYGIPGSTPWIKTAISAQELVSKISRKRLDPPDLSKEPVYIEYVNRNNFDCWFRFTDRYEEIITGE